MQLQQVRLKAEAAALAALTPEALAAREAGLARAAHLLEEQRDEVKRMNQMVLKGLCATQRDAQVTLPFAFRHHCCAAAVAPSLPPSPRLRLAFLPHTSLPPKTTTCIPHHPANFRASTTRAIHATGMRQASQPHAYEGRRAKFDIDKKCKPRRNVKTRGREGICTSAASVQPRPNERSSANLRGTRQLNPYKALSERHCTMPCER